MSGAGKILLISSLTCITTFLLNKIPDLLQFGVCPKS
jgi:hypothetical protein